jgi:hypothetical protein
MINIELLRQREAELRRAAERSVALRPSGDARPRSRERTARVLARLCMLLLARRAGNSDLGYAAGRTGRNRRRLSN